MISVKIRKKNNVCFQVRNNEKLFFWLIEATKRCCFFTLRAHFRSSIKKLIKWSLVHFHIHFLMMKMASRIPSGNINPIYYFILIFYRPNFKIYVNTLNWSSWYFFVVLLRGLTSLTYSLTHFNWVLSHGEWTWRDCMTTIPGPIYSTAYVVWLTTIIAFKNIHVCLHS